MPKDFQQTEVVALLQLHMPGGIQLASQASEASSVREKFPEVKEEKRSVVVIVIVDVWSKNFYYCW